MFIPPGFSQHSIQSSLGRIIYYTNESEPWNSNNIDTNE